MLFEAGKYYHVFNRSNNGEVVFPSPQNYAYFLACAGKILAPAFSLYAYCLMPTHFRFLLLAKKEEKECSNAVGRLLRIYSNSVNKRRERKGSLFQPETVVKHIDDERFLLRFIPYIHQEPVRAGLAPSCDHWEHSSHIDYTGRRCSPIVDLSLMRHHFKTAEAYEQYASTMIPSVKSKYWIENGVGHL